MQVVHSWASLGLKGRVQSTAFVAPLLREMATCVFAETTVRSFFVQGPQNAGCRMKGSMASDARTWFLDPPSTRFLP